jgi:hypothetical protein
VKFWLRQIPSVILVLRLVMLMNLMNLKGNNSKPQHKKKSHRLEQVVQDYQTGDCLKEGTSLSVHLLVQQKV